MSRTLEEIFQAYARSWPTGPMYEAEMVAFRSALQEAREWALREAAALLEANRCPTRAAEVLALASRPEPTPEPRPGWLSERMQSPAFREAFTRPDEPEPAPEPAPESEAVCELCGHHEIHHNSPIANGRCEGEWDRCGCNEWRPAPRSEEDR